jgi:hypothetical protein
VRPDHGGRLELKLVEASEASARYALTVFTPESEVTAQVVVETASGSIDFDAWQGQRPPEWLEALGRALLRTVWRSKNSDGDWPRRVTRWRPAPKP